MITSYAKILESAGHKTVKLQGVDLNPRALEVTSLLCKENKIDNIELSESNLFSTLTGQIFDVIIFNPPYVVTPPEELSLAQTQKGIEASWAGGEHGIQVLLDFLPQALAHLSERGCIYILLISDNCPFLSYLDGFTVCALKWTVLLKREVPGEY